jgi:hypothetical protein
VVRQERQIGSQNLDLVVAEEGEVHQNHQEVEAGEAARQRKALVVVGEHLIEVKEVAEEHLNEVKGVEEERLFAVVVVGAARLTEVREEVVVVRCLSKEGEVQDEKMQAVAGGRVAMGQKVFWEVAEGHSEEAYGREIGMFLVLEVGVELIHDVALGVVP